MEGTNNYGSLETGGYEAAGQKPKRYGMPVDIARIGRALMRNKWVIVGPAALGLAVGVVIAKFVMTNSYLSKADIKYEGTATASGGTDTSERELVSKLALLGADEFLRKVKDELKLEGNLSTVAAQIGLDQDYESNLIRLSLGGDTAAEAAHNVNRLVELFLDHCAGKERAILQAQVDALKDRVAAARRTLEEARKTYDAFREQHGIADLSLEQQQAISSAAESRARSEMTRTEVATLEAQVSELEAQIKSAPRPAGGEAAAAVVPPPSLAPEREQLTRLRGELASLRGRLTSDHPQVQALEQQVRTLELRIRTASGEATGGTSGGLQAFAAAARARSLQSQLNKARTDLDSARARQRGLSTAAHEGQARVEQFSQIEGEASRLLAQVRINEALLTDLQNRRALADDALRHVTSGFVLMSPGTEPDYPEPNKWKKVVALGIPGGLAFIAIFFVLARELRGFRVRTAREVSYWGRGPVIGTTTWPRDAHAVQDLIADLDDFAPEVRGRMLIVGATDAERDLANELTNLLNHDWYPTTIGMEDVPRLGPGSGDATGHSTALARRDANDLLAPLQPEALDMNVRSWEGPASGQALRRAARLADRVAVVVSSGQISAFDLNAIPTRLGRHHGVGYILVGIDGELLGLPDRTGPVEEFWRTVRD